MEFVQGSKLSDVWPNLGDREVTSVVRQLTQLESQMMSLPFPAGGSLYFTKDLEKVAPGLGITLDNERFCVGPDTRSCPCFSLPAFPNASRITMMASRSL